MSEDKLKAYLYASACYRFADDALAGGYDKTRPLISVDGQAISVDAYTRYYQEHEGDDGHEIDSATYKTTKSEAKNYIRSVVTAYKHNLFSRKEILI